MKKLFVALLALSAMVYTCNASQVVDYYDLKLKLRIPRVYNNTESLGYRKLQTQTLTGTLIVTYDDEDYRPSFIVTNLINKTHKLSNGKNVTYTVTVNDYDPFPRLNVIGDNKSGVFKQVTMVFGLECNPSYNIGEIEEDNTLIISLSGFGKASKYHGYPLAKKISGYVTGQLGCGCMVYGHKSPTRLWWWYGPVCDMTDDVAAVQGMWTATFNKKLSCR